MSSILDCSASSDSEDDVDYVPPVGADESADENSPESSNETNSDGEEEVLDSKSKKMKRKKVKNGEKNVKNEVPESNIGKSDSNIQEKDKKKTANDIWETFLSDVESVPSNKVSSEAPKTISHECKHHESSKKISPVSEMFEFAGETFSYNKEENDKGDKSEASSTSKRNVCEKESTLMKNSKTPAPVKRAGLGSVLGALSSKKSKLSILDKTKMDWQVFKADEGIQEDLATFNKGKNAFVERQRFLQRSDVRSFELEKGLRQLSRKK